MKGDTFWTLLCLTSHIQLTIVPNDVSQLIASWFICKPLRALNVDEETIIKCLLFLSARLRQAHELKALTLKQILCCFEASGGSI